MKRDMPTIHPGEILNEDSLKAMGIPERRRKAHGFSIKPQMGGGNGAKRKILSEEDSREDESKPEDSNVLLLFSLKNELHYSQNTYYYTLYV